MNEAVKTLCARLTMVRRKHYGERGKANFARQLGIRATPYQHYEIDRVPSVELLIQAAKLTGTNLHWLLTGEGLMENHVTAIAESLPWAERIQKVVERRPDLAQSLSDFLVLMEQIAVAGPGQGGVPSDSLDTSRFVPVVGSTLAGRARFWKEIDAAADPDDVDRRIQELLKQHAARMVHVCSVAPYGTEPTEIAALVQLSHPDELGFVEFLACPSIKAGHPRAVAWRIDGDSMAPRYDDGDFVVVSPEEPAVDGYPCVAHQAGQIGVNCKIYSRSGEDVMLIPVNETSRPQLMKADGILWAQRVLYSVRTGPWR